MVKRFPSFASLCLLVALAIPSQLMAQRNGKTGAGEEVDCGSREGGRAHQTRHRLATIQDSRRRQATLECLRSTSRISLDQPKPGIVFYHGGVDVVTSERRRTSTRKPSTLAICRGMCWLNSVEYRIKSRHQTTQREAIVDAFSAMRWVKQHAAGTVAWILSVSPWPVARPAAFIGGRRRHAKWF